MRTNPLNQAVQQAVYAVLRQQGAKLLRRRSPFMLAQQVAEAASRITYQTYREIEAEEKSK